MKKFLALALLLFPFSAEAYTPLITCNSAGDILQSNGTNQTYDCVDIFTTPNTWTAEQTFTDGTNTVNLADGTYAVNTIGISNLNGRLLVNGATDDNFSGLQAAGDINFTNGIFKTQTSAPEDGNGSYFLASTGYGFNIGGEAGNGLPSHIPFLQATNFNVTNDVFMMLQPYDGRVGIAGVSDDGVSKLQLAGDFSIISLANYPNQMFYVTDKDVGAGQNPRVLIDDPADDGYSAIQAQDITSNYSVKFAGSTEALNAFNNSGGYSFIAATSAQSFLGSDGTHNFIGPDGTNSFSANGNGVVGGTIIAASFITNGGASYQFVKGDGSLDSNTYLKGSPGTPTCGTGCSSIGAGSTNLRGKATGGTLVTSMVINFSGTLASVPYCNISGSSATAALGHTETTSVLTISLSTALTGDVITWQCAL